MMPDEFLMPDEDWRERGACRGIPVELFFPPVEHEGDEAKSVCEMCSVREPCLEWAMTSGERFGVWGGLTSQERRSLATRRRRESTSTLSTPVAL